MLQLDNKPHKHYPHIQIALAYNLAIFFYFSDFWYTFTTYHATQKEKRQSKYSA